MPNVVSTGDTARRRGHRRGFASDVLKLASGTTISQVVVLAAAPVLSRLYGPSEFGAAALFAAVTAVTIVVACLRYDAAIVLPDSDDEGAALLWASLAVAGLMSAGVLILFLLLPDSVLSYLGADAISGYVPLAALATGFGGVFNALNHWHMRRRRYALLATARVTHTTVTAAVQVGGALVRSGSATMLVAGSLAGSWLAVLPLGGRAAASDRRTMARGFRLRGILRGMRRQWRFPVYNAWTAVMNSVSWQLPVLLLGIYFSPSVVGYYALGWRVLSLPMSLIGGAIGQVFYQRSAGAHREGGLDILVRRVFSAMVDVGFVPFVVLTIAGGDIFEFVFGARWAEAGVYVQILSIYTFVWFVSSPLSGLFLVLDRQDWALWINVGILLTRLGSLMVGGWLGDARVGLAIFAVTGVGVYGYMNQTAMKLAGVRWAEAWRIIGRASVRAVVPCGLVLMTVLLSLGAAWVFIAAAAAVAVSTLRAFASWRRVLGAQRDDNTLSGRDTTVPGAEWDG